MLCIRRVIIIVVGVSFPLLVRFERQRHACGICVHLPGLRTIIQGMRTTDLDNRASNNLAELKALCKIDSRWVPPLRSWESSESSKQRITVGYAATILGKTTKKRVGRANHLEEYFEFLVLEIKVPTADFVSDCVLVQREN